MCEPAHSIIQYPDPDSWRDHDQDDSGLGSGASAQSMQEGYIGKFRKWLKKFGTFCHLSLMGKGHSESEYARIGASPFQLSYNIDSAKFETFWWNREVVIDSYSQYMFKLQRGEIKLPHSYDGELSPLNAAKKYADAVCIGNMTAFRRFIEASIRNTNKPLSYVKSFFGKMISFKGRPTAERSMKKLDTNLISLLERTGWTGFNSFNEKVENGIFVCEYIHRLHTPGKQHTSKSRRYNRRTTSYGPGSITPSVRRLIKFPLESLINLILGLTRKREILVPCWADEPKLWIPDKKLIT